jgi:hypothetical protein
MTEAELLRTFAQRGVARGNELYLRPADALALLHEYDAHGFAVVGAEAAVLQDAATVPRADLIADFSDRAAMDWESYRRQCTIWSRAYLDELPAVENLYVTLVAIDRAGR